jgi:hypothetical protein
MTGDAAAQLIDTSVARRSRMARPVNILIRGCDGTWVGHTRTAHGRGLPWMGSSRTTTRRVPMSSRLPRPAEHGPSGMRTTRTSGGRSVFAGCCLSGRDTLAIAPAAWLARPVRAARGWCSPCPTAALSARLHHIRWVRPSPSVRAELGWHRRRGSNPVDGPPTPAST